MQPTRRMLKVLTAAVASVFVTSAASASLTYELVAISVKKNNSTTVTVANPKSVTEAAVGDIVRLRLYATVTGTDPNKSQTLQSGIGSLLSSPNLNAIKGNWQATRISLNTANTSTAPHISAPWNGVSSSRGLAQDLDGDGDLDLGSNNDAASDNFVAYRAGQLEGPRSNNFLGMSDFGAFVPTTTGASTKYVLSGQIDWAMTSDGAPTQLNWRLRRGENPVWFEDTTETTTDVNDDGSVIQYTYVGGIGGTMQLVGPPVIVGVPEPACAAGIAGLALFALRSRRNRTSNRSV